jgi:hypothetical protein
VLYELSDGLNTVSRRKDELLCAYYLDCLMALFEMDMLLVYSIR